MHRDSRSHRRRRVGRGTLYNGIATSQAASYRATVARNNAQIANQNATRAIAAGQQQAANQSLQNAETIGGIKTAQAANGVDVNSGSALDVQVSQRAKGQLDAQTALQKAQVEAYGYRVNAVSDTGQAQLEQATAENAPIGAGIGDVWELGRQHQVHELDRRHRRQPLQLAERSWGRTFPGWSSLPTS